MEGEAQITWKILGANLQKKIKMRNTKRDDRKKIVAMFLRLAIPK
jgi:hypothetical protein